MLAVVAIPSRFYGLFVFTWIAIAVLTLLTVLLLSDLAHVVALLLGFFASVIQAKALTNLFTGYN